MSRISQTNRTILFESINPNKIDLLTILSNIDNEESISDEIVEKIHSELLINSFDEFLEKFDPTIYSYYDVNKQDIVYSLYKNENIPDDMIQTIKLGYDNQFMKVILNLIEARDINKVQNTKFNYEDILEMLSPKSAVRNIKQLRKEISYLFSKYTELDDENPEKLELADKLNIKFETASKNYKNILSMLPLAIEDINIRLSLESKNKSQNRIDNIKAGLLSISTNGNLEIIESNSSTNLIQIENSFEKSNQLSEYFKADYYENTTNPNEYIANLVARSFAPLNKQIIEIDEQTEIQNYNSYMQLYKNSQENFIKIAKELVSKILAIKLFFNQYDTKSNSMKPSLLISNFNPNLLENIVYKKKIEAFFNTVNNKNDFSNTIWFSILPNINFYIPQENKIIKKRFEGTKLENIKQVNTITTLRNIASICEKFKIQLFFNFSANEYTDFKTLSINGISEYMQKTKELENESYCEYLIPVIPNFTIIPKNRSKVFIGNKLEYTVDNFEKKDQMYFYINGLYIDSSYIAAGLVSAYQCPYYLKERFNNINLNNPGIRINIEAKDNNYRLKTTLPKEISGYTKDIKDKINELNYGFIFSSENAIFEGKSVDNICVYKARNLKKKNNLSYEPIYKTQTLTYIERVLRYETSDFKEDRLEQFFSNSPNSVKTKWQKEQDFENAILRKEDDMSYLIDIKNNVCNLVVSFSGDTRNLNLHINSKE